MNNHDTELLHAVLRSDFVTYLYRCFLHLNPGALFLPNWHIHAIAYQLERVRRGEITRLIINLPPRYLKSITVSVAFPAFLLGLSPSRRIITISYVTSSRPSTQATSDRWFILPGISAAFRACGSCAAPKASCSRRNAAFASRPRSRGL